MRPVVQSPISSVAVGAPVVLDYRSNPEDAGIACVLSNGAVLTYKVQLSNDDPFVDGFNPANATWFDHATLTGQTSSQYGTVDHPARMIRLNVTAYTSGNVTLTLVQSGE